MAVHTTGNLRDALRGATAALHAELDDRLLPLALAPEPVEFLSVQYRALVGLDRAIENLAGPFPLPAGQSARAAKDLLALGAPLPPPLSAPQFRPSKGTSLGIAWCLGGASLGNRAILVRRRKLGLSGTVQFLESNALEGFWSELARVLEYDHPTEITLDAIDAARKVFNHFLAALPGDVRPLAA